MKMLAELETMTERMPFNQTSKTLLRICNDFKDLIYEVLALQQALRSHTQDFQVESSAAEHRLPGEIPLTEQAHLSHSCQSVSGENDTQTHIENPPCQIARPSDLSKAAEELTDLASVARLLKQMRQELIQRQHASCLPHSSHTDASSPNALLPSPDRNEVQSSENTKNLSS